MPVENDDRLIVNEGGDAFVPTVAVGCSVYRNGDALACSSLIISVGYVARTMPGNAAFPRASDARLISPDRISRPHNCRLRIRRLIVPVRKVGPSCNGIAIADTQSFPPLPDCRLDHHGPDELQICALLAQTAETPFANTPVGIGGSAAKLVKIASYWQFLGEVRAW